MVVTYSAEAGSLKINVPELQKQVPQECKQFFLLYCFFLRFRPAFAIPLIL